MEVSASATYCGSHLRTLCEQVRVQIENIELSLASADTEQEERKQIPALQSIADTITRVCRQATEMGAKTEETDGGNLEEEAEGEHGELDSSTDTDEKEQERSGRADVEGEEAVVGGCKIEAAMVGGATADTEEAPWVDVYYKGKSVTEMLEEEFAAYRRCWEREWGNGKGNTFENLCT